MKYFTLSELTHSATAIKYGIDNTPSEEVVKNIELLVEKILDPAREELGQPIFVNCGFRNQEVNKLVGGVKNSQHLIGCAADIWAKDMKKLWDILYKMDFDKLIRYKTFYHISYNGDKNRHQIIMKDTSKMK